MELSILQNVLSQVKGCTFATLDATTKPSAGIKKITTGLRVILFTNKRSSGYDNMVRKRLVEAGKDPDNFVLSDLPWGERLKDSPLIVHNDKYYLQTIVLSEGTSEYFIGETQVDPSGLGLHERRTSQGLAQADEVHVATYALPNITRIVLMGQVLIAENNSLLRVPGVLCDA